MPPHTIIRHTQCKFSSMNTATHCNTLHTREKKHMCGFCPYNTLHVLSLQYTATAYCNTLQHTTTLCNTLHHTAPHCTTLHHTTHERDRIHVRIMFCQYNTLQQHIATHCTTLQHTEAHCTRERQNTCVGNVLSLYTLQQHTSTHCNTLQRTATHCNTLYTKGIEYMCG